MLNKGEGCVRCGCETRRKCCVRYGREIFKEVYMYMYKYVCIYYIYMAAGALRRWEDARHRARLIGGIGTGV